MSPEIPRGPLPQGLVRVIASLNRHLLNMTKCQSGRGPCRAVSHKHLCRLQWGKSAQTMACSLGMHKGPLERMKGTSLPSRGNSTVEGWMFHGAGVPFFPPREPYYSPASMIQRRISQANGTLVLRSHEENRNLGSLELDVDWRPCPTISAF